MWVGNRVKQSSTILYLYASKLVLLFWPSLNSQLVIGHPLGPSLYPSLAVALSLSQLLFSPALPWSLSLPPSPSLNSWVTCPGEHLHLLVITYTSLLPDYVTLITSNYPHCLPSWSISRTVQHVCWVWTPQPIPIHLSMYLVDNPQSCQSNRGTCMPLHNYVYHSERESTYSIYRITLTVHIPL